jgi:hypothetical protein
VAKVDDKHLILILELSTAEDADRIAREVGGPWMREHISPLLAGDTERSVRGDRRRRGLSSYRRAYSSAADCSNSKPTKRSSPRISAS